MTPEGGATSDQSAAGWADWRKVCELLKAGQYQQVAGLLGEAHAAGQHSGNAGLAQILAAARRICLACSQSREEAEWHRQATQEATQREHELGQQLQAILDLVNGGGVPDAPEARETSPAAVTESSLPERGIPESSEPASLWQHVQSLLRRAPDTRSLQRERAVLSGEAAILLSTERVETAITPLAAKKGGQAPPSLVIYCLGPFRAYQDDQLIDNWPSGKGKCIFQYMIANRDRPIPKEVLMDLFWRDADPDAARNNLNVAIYGLRQAFRAARPDVSHILFQEDAYLLNPAMSIWIDVEEFEQHYEAGRMLEKRGKLAEATREYEVAEGLYQGDLFEEDLYQDWPITRRQGLKDSYLIIMDRLSQHYLEKKRYATCIRLCQKILDTEKCQEEAHRRLMRCYNRQGQRNLALRQYSLCVEMLREDLDVLPMDQTVTIYQRIRNGENV